MAYPCEKWKNREEDISLKGIRFKGVCILKKILLLCSTSGSVVGFRKTLIEKLQSEGFNVSVITFDTEHKEEIEKRGIGFYCIEDKNRSMNPFKILSLKSKYKKLIKEICPDIVFTFMLKPNTFGVMAAKSAGVKNIYSMVEGAGDVFINNSFKWKLIRFVVCRLYKKAFKSSRKVFFLNDDDKTEFIRRQLVKEEQCELILGGIGVDLEKFSFKPLKNNRTFLMIARMLKTKGVLEYCKAARIVKQKYPDVVFNYLGAEGTLKLSDIQEYIDDGSVKYLGTTKDVRPYLEEATAYILPSYREGKSVSIMEAEAIGRAIITKNVPGCRESIVENYNGFFANTVSEIVEKVSWFIENPDEAIRMGENSRKFAEENLDYKKIDQRIYEVIDSE